jgi:dihydropteroate synthase
MKLSCGTYQFELSRPLVMGILNVTPDSFSDGGEYRGPEAAIAHARQLMAEGADIIDIGGESSRPGAHTVSVQQELDRVLLVIEALKGIPLSIDTCKTPVMKAALASGVCMVNDINALQNNDAMSLVAASDVAVCLMHKLGNPQTMQMQPGYRDVVADVTQFLRQRVAAAEHAGIDRCRIVIDPGFGFGKTLAHNLSLLRELNKLNLIGVPVLAGLSRKSMLGALTGKDVAHRMPASVAAALIAVQNGATIVRVHDVGATVDALKVWRAVNF